MYFGPAPVWRDELDYKRSGYRSTPEATWPDGYLGTITSRRGDRLMDALKSRQNERSYQRGVHKGERIDPGDYFFPPALQPIAGVLRQMRTDQKFAPLGNDQPTLLINDGKASPAPTSRGIPRVDAPGQTVYNPRAEQLRRLAPGWN